MWQRLSDSVKSDLKDVNMDLSLVSDLSLVELFCCHDPSDCLTFFSILRARDHKELLEERLYDEAIIYEALVIHRTFRIKTKIKKQHIKLRMFVHLRTRTNG